MSNRKRKRSNSFQSNNNSNPTKKQRKIRQRYLDTESVISSLTFHPTTHTFAASCFDGRINLYQINEQRITTFSHSLHHPNHYQNQLKTQTLKDLIQNNQNKLKRLKELQSKNNNTFDDKKYDEEEDNDTDSDGSLSSISLTNDNNNNYDSRSISCKQTIFNDDGSLIIGAWRDSQIGIFDYKTSKLIHHFNNNEFDKDQQSTKLTTLKMYNHRTLISGDCDGIIRCWDIRINLNKNNKSQRQYQYTSTQKHLKTDDNVSILHTLNEHEDGINCFESVPNKHRLFAGSSDGQLSVWDLRKSSDINAIKAEIQRKKDKERRQNKYKNKNRNELFDIFGVDEEEIKPKTLKAMSDRMGDEILSLCLMKFGTKLCCGMTSGYMNVFSWNDWEWYGDRVKGHAQNLNCIIKYDEDCCITGCHDGVVRLISLYPHKFIHSIGTHDLNPIDAIALSHDKEYVVSYASGNKRTMTKYNRTNRTSLRKNHALMKNANDILKIWDMEWHPEVIYKEKEKRKRDKYNRKRHLNQCKLPKGIKQFLELDDDDYSFGNFDVEEDVGDKKVEKEVKHDDYEFSDDEESLDEHECGADESDMDDSDDDSNDDDDDENVSGIKDEDDRKRRIRYKTFNDREHWIKSLGYRKKIRPFGRHDVEQYNNRKFFRDLCL